MEALSRVRQPATAKVTALGIVEASPESIAQLRKQPGTWSAAPETPAALLKLADDQAVLATVALLRAIEQAGWRQQSFAEWAVIAAPRFLGRGRGAAAIGRYLQLGPRAVSPLIIPTLSLHAISGLASMILQSHGSNFGVCGEHSQVSEGLLNGLVLQDRSRLPGVWVILTGWEPEPIPDEKGQARNSVMGYGIALALGSADSAQPGWLLHYEPASTNPASEIVTIRDFAHALQSAAPERWLCPVLGGGQLILNRPVEQARAA